MSDSSTSTVESILVISTKDTSQKRPRWSAEEDQKLISYMSKNSLPEKWDDVPKQINIYRSGKSCNHRWENYLNPSLEKGPLSEEEKKIILKLHSKHGNQWAKIRDAMRSLFFRKRSNKQIKNFVSCLNSKQSRECHASSSMQVFSQVPDVELQTFHNEEFGDIPNEKSLSEEWVDNAFNYDAFDNNDGMQSPCCGEN